MRNSLETALTQVLTQRRQKSALRTLTLPAANSIDFSSNDFLSLSHAPSLRRLLLSELSTSSLPLGSGGSRLLDGNSAYAEQLERDIAAFLKGPAGLIFNSGFDANAGFFACVPQPGDVLIYDELIHASVHEGMRLSRAGSRIPFRHNDVGELRQILASHSGKGRNIFVAVESLYSMDGDLAPLQQLVEAVERAEGHLVVDEAHATGVFGPRGRGLVCELGLEKRVFARLHTFGKALACNGAIILCSPLLREYLINYARTLIFTTALSLPSLACIKAAFTLLQSGETEAAQHRLHDTIRHLHQQLQQHLPSTPLAALQNPLVTNTPIVSLLSRRPRSLAAFLQQAAFVVRPIVHPTVPRGLERVRICVHAANTRCEVDALVARIREWVEGQVEQEDEEGGAEVGRAKL